MSTKLRDIFDLQTAPLFYQSAREIAGDHANPFTQQMLLAWEKLQLSGIYCVAGRPTMYFKEVPDESPAIADLQLSLWNQGIAPLLVLSGPVSVWIISGMTRPVKAQDQERLIVNQVNAVADALYLKRFINSVETGAIFCEHPTKFNQNQTVDRYLVANLQELARQLFTLLHKQDKGRQGGSLTLMPETSNPCVAASFWK